MCTTTFVGQDCDFLLPNPKPKSAPAPDKTSVQILPQTRWDARMETIVSMRTRVPMVSVLRCGSESHKLQACTRPQATVFSNGEREASFQEDLC